MKLLVLVRPRRTNPGAETRDISPPPNLVAAWPHPSTPCQIDLGSLAADRQTTAQTTANVSPRRSANLGSLSPRSFPIPYILPSKRFTLLSNPTGILLLSFPNIPSKHPRYPYLPLDLHHFPDSSKHIATMPQRVIVVGGGREYPPASAAAIAASASPQSSGLWLTFCDSVRPQRGAHHLPRRRQRRCPGQAG